jgi:spectrin beta
LRERSEAKREELASAHGVQTFHIECRETVTWIEDKMRVLEQTDELKMDLTGIMTLQRKLTGMYLRSLNSINSSLSTFSNSNNLLCQFSIIEHSRSNYLIHAKFWL